MNHITPEQAGVSSESIKQFIELLEEKQLSTHDLIFMKGDSIFFEKYWEPFHKNFLHRMYSVSKSFVSLAIGFAEQDGLLNLDDRITKYFPNETENQSDENVRNQTIRHMLMMSTAKPAQYWFDARTDDRVRLYFENEAENSRPSGTIFEYDSPGSFVLCALAERLTGKNFIEYLREKLFDKIGVSSNIHCLKCPGGHSWGDSAILCTAEDLLRVARFTMNLGEWDGEQILNREYVSAAISKQIDNNVLGICDYDTLGYGYLFWRTYENSYFFNGMGCQLAVCVPDKDLIMVYNADNQGIVTAKKTVIDGFFSIIADKMSDVPLENNEIAHEELENYCSNLKLIVAKGEYESEYSSKIDGVTYQMGKNPMKISKMRIKFEGDCGYMEYSNEQGDKTLHFGIGKNVFSKFPQMGYSKEVGSESCGGHMYDCAASAAWVEPRKLLIKVQIIDEYFGNLNITVSFTESADKVGVYMVKTAEDFLGEYEGFAGGAKEL